MTDDAVTADALLRGRVRLYQPAHGARMSLDPVLLAGFVAPPFGRFLDIGCGTGPLSFLLLAGDPAASGVGVEIQPRLAALAVRGRNENGWGARLDVVDGDVRGLGDRLSEASFDLVITNPPYRTVASSPPSPNPERALAFNEIALRLAEWVEVAARAVRPGGRVAAILPAERSAGAAARASEGSPAPHSHPARLPAGGGAGLAHPGGSSALRGLCHRGRFRGAAPYCARR